ncbi:hydroxypyruvate isomerase [Pseudomonas sp. Tn43]|uniref:TIM barrel protein n=1 Tax=Pseudomonas sp. Tn43 TaxID=701213 RepID=UPI00160D2F38|nr:TIM barrel protein [Pseudomonas sp. Tn43]MBB3240129.1 hydroxypyruvate isomerase [Pseudomonas sp. Tn43]
MIKGVRRNFNAGVASFSFISWLAARQGWRRCVVQFSASLTLMFQEWVFADRFAAARDAGFEAVEFSHPQGMSAERVAGLLRQNDLIQVLATAPVIAGTKGVAAVIGREADFRDALEQGLEFASIATAPLLHVLTGVVDQTHYASSCGRFVDNMQWAVEEARRYDVKIVIEAINQMAVPGYFIRSLSSAAHWAQQIHGLGLILDLYHAAVEGLPAESCLAQYADQASHVQIANLHGRSEPDSTLLAAVARAGYKGWVGAEYVPKAGTVEGLTWMNGGTQPSLANC